MITDLGDAVHAVTLVKAAGAASADPAASEAERARAADLAGTPLDAGAGPRLADAAQGP